jgi:hypothetical protein
MAEQIISPGVFTRENDQSFLPQGIGQIGAAIVGPTSKGPAFVPTVIRNYGQFVSQFGEGIEGGELSTYVPQTVKEYLNHAGSVTVCRVLAGSGYSLTDGTNEFIALGLFPSGSEEGLITSVVFPSKHNTATMNLGGSTLTNQTPSSASGTFLGQDVFYNTGSSYLVSGSNGEAGTLHLKLSGSPSGFFEFTGSTNPSSLDYIWNQIGHTADNSKSGTNAYGNNAGYTYVNFRGLQTKLFNGTATGYKGGVYSGKGYAGTAHGSASAVYKLITQSGANLDFNGDGLGKAEGYSYASTPWVHSQIAKGRKELFRVHTINHGKEVSRDFKVSIANLVEPSDIDNVEQYSEFSVIIRKFNDNDNSPVILEQYNDCNLDPDSPNYIARKIGNRYPEFNETLAKVELKGDFPNNSQRIRIEVAASVKSKSNSPKLSPKGFKAISDPIKMSVLAVSTGNKGIGEVAAASTHYFPSASYEGVQTLEAGTTPLSYSPNGFLGFKFVEKELDNDIWIRSLPDSPENNVSGHFSVEDYSGHPSSSLWTGSLSGSVDITGNIGPTPSQLKFTLPFQGGNDGIAPWTVKQVGENISSTNVFGFNIEDTSKAGYTGYKKALDILSNQDEYDINMLSLPGIIHQHHSPVTDYAIQMAETRGDCFYVMDLGDMENTVLQDIDQVGSLDSNYTAVYYPWVKINDASTNKPVYVPPSVIVPGAIAQSDKVGAEWFAPAGLNRGVLGSVLEARNNLTQSERDQLYQNRINPIASFPATGICIWGQKTLQKRSTALDRINVRRLLITMKKFIASSSKYLVFEQNSLQTRTRFLNIVNPYLENIQQRQGLYAFRVVMDDTNNTSIVIDRNELVGAIYIQPTKTAEFIILDFNVMPTGATFPS